MAKTNSSRQILWLGLLLVGWFALYECLPALADWLTFSLIGLEKGSHLGESIRFFLYDTPKVFLLLLLVVFGVGILRTFFTPERTRQLLAGRSELAGGGLAALLGVATPFCSCSAVPLFIGFVTAGVPLGVTFAFLIASPMVNEIALALLFALFGWQVALLYAGTGLAIAVVSGWIIGRLKLEKWVEPWVWQMQAAASQAEDEKLDWNQRIRRGREAVRDIVGKVWPYLLAGIAIGAGIHGYVPQDALAAIMGKEAWWSVPAAVLIGIPLYSNAAGIIPVVQALIGKGAALGTVLAFMMATIGLSLPEAIILRKVLTLRLLLVFFGIVAAGILATGWLFNWIL
jgi:uncharacterized membrane protein YraQ (UPF0718 family)